MKGMKSLIRLHRWQLDEERRRLGDLEGLAADIRAQIAAIQDRLKSEAALARGSAEDARAYSAFLNGERSRRQRLEASLADLEREVEEARARVAEAFRRVKTFEISLGNRERQRARKRRRRDQADEDEIAQNAHQRKSRA